MRCTSSRSVGASLLAIGLANVKKKFLVVSAPGVWGSWPLGLPPTHAPREGDTA